MAAKNKFMNAMKMPAIADMFSSEADRQRESGDLVTGVPLSELHPFVNHPFEVRDDEDMQKLVDSIKENGVLTNLTVRPRAEGGYRYYLIPDAMTRALPEQFEKQTPTEFFDNIADLEKRYHQLREMPYNNERTWNERTRFPYARLVVGIDRQNPDGAVAIIQVRNGINYLCDDYRGPYAGGSDAQIPQMAKKLVEVIGVDRVRPHTYTQRDGYTWVQVEKDIHITEWLYAHELCSSLQFTRFLNRDGRELFQVRDGQRVIETNADGTKRLRAVKNIDVTHAYVGH